MEKTNSKSKSISSLIIYMLVIFGAGVVFGSVVLPSAVPRLTSKEHDRQVFISAEKALQQKASVAKKEAKDREIKEFQIRLAGAILKLRPNIGPRTAKEFAGYIITESKANDLDPKLVTALIWTESGFNPLAHSKMGAVGLMQVRYSTWKETPLLKDNDVSAKHKLFWPELNIKCGTKILAKYYEQSDHNIAKTLYRYNTGSPKLPKDKSVLEITYINKIMLTAYRVSDLMSREKINLTEELEQLNKQ